MDESYVEVIVLVVDQEMFDSALGEFLDEVTQVLALFPLKAPGLDFGPELAQIQASKVKLDAALEGAKVADPAPAPDPGQVGVDPSGAPATGSSPSSEPTSETAPLSSPDPSSSDTSEMPSGSGAWSPDLTPAPDAPVDASAPAEAPAEDAGASSAPEHTIG